MRSAVFCQLQSYNLLLYFRNKTIDFFILFYFLNIVSVYNSSLTYTLMYLFHK